MEHTKGELRRDKGFDGCYEALYIGSTQIAIVQEKVPKKEAIANAEHLVKCWNSHDDLLEIANMVEDMPAKSDSLFDVHVANLRAKAKVAIAKAKVT